MASSTSSTISSSTLAADLYALGLRRGDEVMVHSSFKSLGIADPEMIIGALLDVLGDTGTLLMPALSYQQQPKLVHDTRTTPACVGFLPEYFRTRPGSKRSFHPTHSVSAVGAGAGDLLDTHRLDVTPCGEHSPFHALLERHGKILMLGCGLRPNTTMHAVEEYARPPYLFGEPVVYTLTDANGRVFEKQYTPHGFKGFAQRYDRVADILAGDALRHGPVGKADCYLIDSPALKAQALVQLRSNPFYFVDPKPVEA